MHPTVEHIREAVVAICAGRLAEAESALRRIDYDQLVREQAANYAGVWGTAGVATGFKPPPARVTRVRPSPTEVRATYLRDCYTCRYVHCQRPTVSVDVLRLISKAAQDVFPYSPTWSPRASHIVYWVYGTSLEHLRSFSEVGALAAASDNLVTACYACNDLKNYLPIELLGWTITAPRQSDWLGLTETLPRLRIAVAALSPVAGTGRDRKGQQL